MKNRLSRNQLITLILALTVGATTTPFFAWMYATDSPPIVLANVPKSQEKPLVGGYVASGKGKVYYFPWCGNAFRIKKENRRVFSSESEAVEAGFRAAKGCRGLQGG